MKSKVLTYSGFMLKLIEAESTGEVPIADSSVYSRVEIPFAPNNVVEMQRKGYVFVDRTLGVTINLRKSDDDYQKMIRFETRLAEDEREQILKIALKSFPCDRRFHVRPLPDADVAETIMRDWVKDLQEVYVCIHKNQIVGFLDLESYGERDSFIHLAAVHEKYRVAGVAVSLYAQAIVIAKNKKCDKLYGRISSANTAVMNLYAHLGGVFSNPIDVFVRDER